jgi:hypothetical protein
MDARESVSTALNRRTGGLTVTEMEAGPKEAPAVPKLCHGGATNGFGADEPGTALAIRWGRVLRRRRNSPRRHCNGTWYPGASLWRRLFGKASALVKPMKMMLT